MHVRAWCVHGVCMVRVFMCVCVGGAGEGGGEGLARVRVLVYDTRFCSRLEHCWSLWDLL